MAKKGTKWTDEEIDLLEECYQNKMLMPEIQKLFPSRTPKAIHKKAYDLGFKQKYPKSDIDYSARHKWTKEEEALLEEEYSKLTSVSEIAKKFGMTEDQISHKAVALGLTKKYVRKNNTKFEAVYQDYDWCFDRYIIKGMSHKEMAKEAGCSLRAIQKWCVEKHGLHSHNFKSYKKLSDLQKEIIMAGTLGDGHIALTNGSGIYIEEHCEAEKDYVYWKYSALKDLCNREPKRYDSTSFDFGTDKMYECQPFYRFNTKMIDELLEIKDVPRIEKISQLSKLGFCLHILDDGNRSNLWNVCLAGWTQDEMDTYQSLVNNKFGLICKQCKDTRYYQFDAKSSNKIDEMILSVLPNELDIIKKKITENSHIKKLANYKFVETQDGNKIGLSAYCKKNSLTGKYEDFKKIYSKFNVDSMSENDLLERIEDAV